MTGRAPAGQAPSNLSLGIRPEHMRLSDDGIHATVTSVEYLGADSLVEARIADQPLIVRVPGKIGLDEGQTIGLDWDSDHEHFFDTATGKRLS